MIAQISKVDLRPNLRELVLNNVDQVVRRARVMSCKLERDRVSSPRSILSCSALTIPSTPDSHRARPCPSTRASSSSSFKPPRPRTCQGWSQS